MYGTGYTRYLALMRIDNLPRVTSINLNNYFLFWKKRIQVTTLLSAKSSFNVKLHFFFYCLLHWLFKYRHDMIIGALSLLPLLWTAVSPCSEIENFPSLSAAKCSIKPPQEVVCSRKEASSLIIIVFDFLVRYINLSRFAFLETFWQLARTLRFKELNLELVKNITGCLKQTPFHV